MTKTLNEIASEWIDSAYRKPTLSREDDALRFSRYNMEVAFRAGVEHSNAALTAYDTALARAEAAEAELARVRELVSRDNDEICQALGKVLDYPWFRDDQVNFPGATEEQGVCVGDHVAASIADEAARKIASLRSQIEEKDKALEPFAEVAKYAKGKPDACWCGQAPAVIRYRDLEVARAARGVKT